MRGPQIAYMLDSKLRPHPSFRTRVDTGQHCLGLSSFSLLSFPLFTYFPVFACFSLAFPPAFASPVQLAACIDQD